MNSSPDEKTILLEKKAPDAGSIATTDNALEAIEERGGSAGESV